MDLINNLLSKTEQLDTSLKKLRETGSNLAQATRNYKVAVNQKALQLRDDKMAVGMITLTIYGYRDIAELRFKRDVAEVVYKANLEAINTLKLQCRILESTIQREWGSAK